MAESDKEAKQEGPRSFAVLVRDMCDGEAEAELSYQLHELCKRMQEEASARGDKVKGAITLSVRMIAEPKGFVGLAYEVTVKAPKRKTSPAMFWLTKGGNLTAENPRQQTLSLRDVSGGSREVRDVAPTAGAAREV